MAGTSYGVNHPLAVKTWAKALERETVARTYMKRFLGGTGAILHRRDELEKGAGDKITYGLRMALEGEGVLGDGTLEGNEEALTIYDESIFIDQLRHAVRSGGKMSEQRVPWSTRAEARNGLATWWSERYDEIWFNHLCGNVVANATPARAGMNTITAPDSDHIIWAETGATSDSDLDSTGDTFTLSLVDKAVERAKTLAPLMQPIMVNGKKMWVIFLHPYQVTAMRTNTSTGQWLDIQKAAMDGGKVEDNPIFTGALGVYNNCILHESNRVTTGVASDGTTAISTVRRAVLCGAQATTISFGRRNRETNYSWHEELFDYGNQLGVSAGAIFGIKKNVYNSKDFGTIVISTYATQAE